MSFIAKLWKKIWASIKKLLSKLGPLLVIVAIILIVMAPYLITALGPVVAGGGFLGAAASVVVAIGSLGPLACLAIGLGLAFVADPEGTTALLSRAAKAVGEIGASLVTGVVSGVASGLGLGGIAVGAAVALGVFFLLKSNSNGSSEDDPADDSYDTVEEDALDYQSSEYEGELSYD